MATDVVNVLSAHDARGIQDTSFGEHMSVKGIIGL